MAFVQPTHRHHVGMALVPARPAATAKGAKGCVVLEKPRLEAAVDGCAELDEPQRDDAAEGRAYGGGEQPRRAQRGLPQLGMCVHELPHEGPRPVQHELVPAGKCVCPARREQQGDCLAAQRQPAAVQQRAVEEGATRRERRHERGLG